MSNVFEDILQKLVHQGNNTQFWFNFSKDLLAYHYDGKRGLAIRRPKQKQVIELPLGVFLLRNNGTYTPQIALQNENFEFVCIEYPDKVQIDTAIAQAILLDFCAKRALIAQNPRNWYDTWSKMIGNAEFEVNPYPVLAELLMLKKCMEHGLVSSAVQEWTGPNGKLHDIELIRPAVSIEVKSTANRGKNSVTISSAYQLEPTRTNNSSAKPLYLAFFTFQAATLHDGWTLEKVIQEFSTEDQDILTDICQKKEKVKEGGLGWNDKAATVVSCKYYRIDKNFPKITSANFDGGVFPPGIAKIIYDVNLDGVSQIPEEDFFAELQNQKEGVPAEHSELDNTPGDNTEPRALGSAAIPPWLQQLRGYLEKNFPGVHQFDDLNGEICVPVFDNERYQMCLFYPFHDDCELYKPILCNESSPFKNYRRGEIIPGKKCKESFPLLASREWATLGCTVGEWHQKMRDFYTDDVGFLLDVKNSSESLCFKPYDEFGAPPQQEDEEKKQGYPETRPSAELPAAGETVHLSDDTDLKSKFTSRRCDWLEFTDNGETIRLNVEQQEKRGSFKNLVVKVAAYVWKNNPAEVENKMQTKGYADIAASIDKFNRSEKTGAFTKISDGCFVNTKLSAVESVKFMLNLLKICGVSPENVRIHLEDTVTRVRTKAEKTEETAEEASETKNEGLEGLLESLPENEREAYQEDLIAALQDDISRYNLRIVRGIPALLKDYQDNRSSHCSWIRLSPQREEMRVRNFADALVEVARKISALCPERLRSEAGNGEWEFLSNHPQPQYRFVADGCYIAPGRNPEKQLQFIQQLLRLAGMDSNQFEMCLLG